MRAEGDLLSTRSAANRTRISRYTIFVLERSKKLTIYSKVWKNGFVHARCSRRKSRLYRFPPKLKIFVAYWNTHTYTKEPIRFVNFLEGNVKKYGQWWKTIIIKTIKGKHQHRIQIYASYSGHGINMFKNGGRIRYYEGNTQEHRLTSLLLSCKSCMQNYKGNLLS